jgi:hypothetical protein
MASYDEASKICQAVPRGTVGTGETACIDADGCAADPCFPGVVCTDSPAPAVATARTCGVCPVGQFGTGKAWQIFYTVRPPLL